MKRSTDRILTTHVGSLPRPDDLLGEMEEYRLGHTPIDEKFRSLAAAAVDEVVRRQREVGIDVISDGEQSKTGYVEYVATRLSGIRVDHVPPGERAMNPA